MLFSSASFVFLFLPVSLVGFYLLARLRPSEAKLAWIALCSLFFYAYWRLDYLPLLVGSVCVNYGVSRAILSYRMHAPNSLAGKLLLIGGIAFNLILLGIFKYLGFAMEIASDVSGAQITPIQLVLPLAISFFTFQQIAFLVDCYKGIARASSFLNYLVFVTFFPQLIAGPIVHHKEMMPQFKSAFVGVLRWKNIYIGATFFALGLFKKLGIADQLAVIADQGYADHQNMTFLDAWFTSLSYTFQLYFDFSGYSDMAIGGARMFGIRLPQNFNSPYKALSLQDFWRRWHMTLSRFLRDYVYIPLGGGRRSPARVSANQFTTFLLGGLWHGAGWTFIIWGAIHGAYLVIERLVQPFSTLVPNWLKWAITFLIVHLAWVFFRAENVPQAMSILKKMSGLDGFATGSINNVITENERAAVAILCAALIAFFLPNTHQFARNLKPVWKTTVAGVVLGAACSLMLTSRSEVFLYFNF